MGCVRLMPCNNRFVVVGGGWWSVRPLFVVDFMLGLTLKPQHVTVMCSVLSLLPGKHYDNINKILKPFPSSLQSTLGEVVVVTKHQERSHPSSLF